MAFFNKKEDVMSVKLTNKGKQKYAAGRFKPAFYSFLDDDVTYQLSGSEEAQNDIVTRITEQTPRQKDTDEVNAEVLPLGNAAGSSEYMPALRFISRTSRFHFDVDPILEKTSVEMVRSPWIRHIVMEDGAFDIDAGEEAVTITPKAFLIELSEINGVNSEENYEITVERLALASGSQTVLEDEHVFEKLWFVKEQEEVVDGLLVDSKENEIEITPEFVEHFLNITVDEEIEGFDEMIEEQLDSLVVRKAMKFPSIPKRKVYVHPYKEDTQLSELYQSNVKKEDIEEDCE